MANKIKRGKLVFTVKIKDKNKWKFDYFDKDCSEMVFWNDDGYCNDKIELRISLPKEVSTAINNLYEEGIKVGERDFIDKIKDLISLFKD